ncbi:MAG: hypothetical protein NC930_06170, partial [Candidatus Omnitrophica bacterium]|nr:hypothetical protein [Candidatus Omnitrophota bacterium]
QRRIQDFQKEYGIQIVAVEGASAKLDPQIFKSFPDKDVLKQIFGEYLDRGELTGVTAASIFGDSKAEYYGIEDWELYEEGLAYYLSAIESETLFASQLTEWDNNLRARKERTYSRVLLTVDCALDEFRKNQIDLLQVLSVLAKVRRPPKDSDLFLLLQARYDQGKSLPQIENEVKRIARRVRDYLNSKADEPKTRVRIQTFNEKWQEYQISMIAPEAFALFLKELTAGDPIAFSASDRLSALMENHKRMRDIEGTKLFRDFEKYAQSVKRSLLRSDAERSLDNESRILELAGRLMRLELTYEDWQEIKSQDPRAKTRDRRLETKDSRRKTRDKKQKTQGSIPELRDAASQVQAPKDADLWSLVFDLGSSQIAFYENAETRDDVFWKKLSPHIRSSAAKKRAVIFVAGGFHTQGMAQKFRENHVSYLLVRPQMTGVPENTPYRDHMRGVVSWNNYFEIRDGKVNLYDAFVRAARDKLLSADPARIQNVVEPRRGSVSNPRSILKQWRDQIIRELASRNETEKAGEYTAYLEGVSSAIQPEDEFNRRLSKVDEFIESLKELESQGQLTEQNILKLLKPATMVEAVKAASLVRLPDAWLGMSGVRAVRSNSQVILVPRQGSESPRALRAVFGRLPRLALQAARVEPASRAEVRRDETEDRAYRQLIDRVRAAWSRAEHLEPGAMTRPFHSAVALQTYREILQAISDSGLTLDYSRMPVNVLGYVMSAYLFANGDYKKVLEFFDWAISMAGKPGFHHVRRGIINNYSFFFLFVLATYLDSDSIGGAKKTRTPVFKYALDRLAPYLKYPELAPDFDPSLRSLAQSVADSVIEFIQRYYRYAVGAQQTGDFSSARAALDEAARIVWNLEQIGILESESGTYSVRDNVKLQKALGNRWAEIMAKVDEINRRSESRPTLSANVHPRGVHRAARNYILNAADRFRAAHDKAVDQGAYYLDEQAAQQAYEAAETAFEAFLKAVEFRARKVDRDWLWDRWGLSHHLSQIGNVEDDNLRNLAIRHLKRLSAHLPPQSGVKHAVNDTIRQLKVSEMTGRSEARPEAEEIVEEILNQAHLPNLIRGLPKNRFAQLIERHRSRLRTSIAQRKGASSSPEAVTVWEMGHDVSKALRRAWIFIEAEISEIMKQRGSDADKASKISAAIPVMVERVLQHVIRTNQHWMDRIEEVMMIPPGTPAARMSFPRWSEPVKIEDEDEIRYIALVMLQGYCSGLTAQEWVDSAYIQSYRSAVGFKNYVYDMRTRLGWTFDQATVDRLMSHLTEKRVNGPERYDTFKIWTYNGTAAEVLRPIRVKPGEVPEEFIDAVRTISSAWGQMVDAGPVEALSASCQKTYQLILEEANRLGTDETIYRNAAALAQDQEFLSSIGLQEPSELILAIFYSIHASRLYFMGPSATEEIARNARKVVQFYEWLSRTEGDSEFQEHRNRFFRSLPHYRIFFQAAFLDARVRERFRRHRQQMAQRREPEPSFVDYAAEILGETFDHSRLGKTEESQTKFRRKIFGFFWGTEKHLGIISYLIANGHHTFARQIIKDLPLLLTSEESAQISDALLERWMGTYAFEIISSVYSRNPGLGVVDHEGPSKNLLEALTGLISGEYFTKLVDAIRERARGMSPEQITNAAAGAIQQALDSGLPEFIKNLNQAIAAGKIQVSPTEAQEWIATGILRMVRTALDRLIAEITAGPARSEARTGTQGISENEGQNAGIGKTNIELLLSEAQAEVTTPAEEERFTPSEKVLGWGVIAGLLAIAIFLTEDNLHRALELIGIFMVLPKIIPHLVPAKSRIPGMPWTRGGYTKGEAMLGWSMLVLLPALFFALGGLVPGFVISVLVVVMLPRIAPNLWPENGVTAVEEKKPARPIGSMSSRGSQDISRAETRATEVSWDQLASRIDALGTENRMSELHSVTLRFQGGENTLMMTPTTLPLLRERFGISVGQGLGSLLQKWVAASVPSSVNGRLNQMVFKLSRTDGRTGYDLRISAEFGVRRSEARGRGRDHLQWLKLLLKLGYMDLEDEELSYFDSRTREFKVLFVAFLRSLGTPDAQSEADGIL